jgi:SAM-dependent methyltransferase
VSLSGATFHGRPLGLEGAPPYPARALVPWTGKRIALPCDDAWVRQTGTEAHAYLDGARDGWTDHPEHMDFLDPRSPVHGLKRLERELYLHHWAPWLDAGTVLDVGAGIGRFTSSFLDRGATVHAVDADLESLRRLVWHAAGRPGNLDVHWTSVHTLPEVEVDLAVAAEVLCYVPDVVPALRGVASRVKPGGTVLLSLEARWGWATAQDAPADAVEAALGGDGVVSVPGDRWVRTYEEVDVVSLLRAAGLVPIDVVPSHWIPDGPLEDVAPEGLRLDALIALEERCRTHPIWGPLNRLWLAAARREAW